MSKRYSADHLDNEKSDPHEGSSLKWINVPLMLLSLFVGFGITYLTLQTDGFAPDVGDKRGSARVAAEKPPADSEVDSELGARLYKKHCQACHQADGKGLGQAFPPLDGSAWVQEEPKRLAAILLHGINGEIEVLGQTYQGAMPAFKTQLSDQEVAAVASYVRGSWSNRAAPIDDAVVEAVREETAERSSPWEGQQELEQYPSGS